MSNTPKSALEKNFQENFVKELEKYKWKAPVELNGNTDKVTVEKGTLHLEETDIGYVIRDEQVVKGNNYKNGMEQIKNEGEKTAKGESIYRYYSKNEENLKKQITELDEKIQEALKGQTGIFSSDIKMLENQLDEKIELLNSTKA